MTPVNGAVMVARSRSSLAFSSWTRAAASPERARAFSRRSWEGAWPETMESGTMLSVYATCACATAASAAFTSRSSGRGSNRISVWPSLTCWPGRTSTSSIVPVTSARSLATSERIWPLVATVRIRSPFRTMSPTTGSDSVLAERVTVESAPVPSAAPFLQAESGRSSAAQRGRQARRVIRESELGVGAVSGSRVTGHASWDS